MIGAKIIRLRAAPSAQDDNIFRRGVNGDRPPGRSGRCAPAGDREGRPYALEISTPHSPLSNPLPEFDLFLKTYCAEGNPDV